MYIIIAIVIAGLILFSKKPISTSSPSPVLIAAPIQDNSKNMAQLPAPYYAFNGTPNTLAPNPPPNPTFETTVPEIASAVVKNSYIPESDLLLGRNKWLV